MLCPSHRLSKASKEGAHPSLREPQESCTPHRDPHRHPFLVFYLQFTLLRPWGGGGARASLLRLSPSNQTGRLFWECQVATLSEPWALQPWMGSHVCVAQEVPHPGSAPKERVWTVLCKRAPSRGDSLRGSGNVGVEGKLKAEVLEQIDLKEKGPGQWGHCRRRRQGRVLPECLFCGFSCACRPSPS